MITLKNISKSFGSELVLEDISFTVNSGEFISVVGESGTGKSTLLSIILGSVSPSRGEVYINELNVTEHDIADRRVGIVFQQCALFPTMSVLDNVAYPLRKNKYSKADAYKKAEDYLSLTGLSDHLRKKPHMLSGGQSQRVAIARMLAMDYPTLLMDEPFSALDPNIRAQLRTEIYAIQRKLSLTVIYVTHDIEEALYLSDRVLVLHDGKIQQYDPPAKIISKPANNYVHSYICVNLLNRMEILKNLTGSQI